MAGEEMNKTALFAAIAGACLSLCACGSGGAGTAPLAGASLGGPFSLVDQDGRRVTDEDFIGKHRLVYFGFSYCPDVCPVDLQRIGQGLRQFEKSDPARGARIVPIFVTVDPARDTPATLKPYAAAFHPRLVALTGSEAEIAAAAKRYGIAYSKRPGAGADAYTMDHSRIAALYGPDGRPIAIVPQDEGAGAVAETLALWVK